MTLDSKYFSKLFRSNIEAWHERKPLPAPSDTLACLLYDKILTDTEQWHMEDEIRKHDISPSLAIVIKYKIDASNLHRTDVVEKIEDLFVEYFDKYAKPLMDGYRTPTESPAWAIDRLSILELKIYHMKEQTLRKDVSEEHIIKSTERLQRLLRQREDLQKAINSLVDDILCGKAKMCVYRQEKLYNDPSTNPALYKK